MNIYEMLLQKTIIKKTYSSHNKQITNITLHFHYTAHYMSPLIIIVMYVYSNLHLFLQQSCAKKEKEILNNVSVF